MRPLTLTTPKPLLKVRGKPILEHIVQALPAQVDDLIIVIGYLGEQIKEYCGDLFCGRKVTYVWQKEKTGTAKALWLCEPHITGKFFMIYADDILGADDFERTTHYDLALMVATAEHPEKFGVVMTNDDMSIREIVEKPAHPESNLVNAGGMILDRRVFDFEATIETSGEYYLTTNMIEPLIKKYKVYAVPAHLWIPIGTPEALQKAETMLQ